MEKTLRSSWPVLVMVTLAMLALSLPVPAHAEDKTRYYYMDDEGKLHPAKDLDSIPDRYQNRIKVEAGPTTSSTEEKSGAGSAISFITENLTLISSIFFWSIAILFALLHASGKLEQGYYSWIEYMKHKQGIDGLYRERHNQTHDRYLELIFGLAGKLSRVDGAVQRAEIDATEQFISERLHLEEKDSQKAKKYFRKGRDSKRSFNDFLNECNEVFGNRPELLQLAYSFLELIAEADGHISKEEEALLLIARNVLGIKTSFFSDTAHPSDFTLDEAYAILDCSPHDDFSLIKRKYRKLVVKYHPDKLNAQGMSGEFVQLAKEQFLKVQEAYEQIEAAQKAR